jgi:type I restriction enzyme S subunit
MIGMSSFIHALKAITLASIVEKSVSVCSVDCYKTGHYTLLGGDIIILRRKGITYDSSFLSNYLTEVKRNEIAERTQGITIHHLYGKDLKTLKLELPPLPEQTAIATVLSDMDAELAALEERLEKTRAIKQGMMQELLTGKTRLV